MESLPLSMGRGRIAGRSVSRSGSTIESAKTRCCRAGMHVSGRFLACPR